MGAMGDSDEVSSPWGAPEVVADFATRGSTDAGEPRAMGSVARWARGRVLDIGVGGGRTTGLLAPGAASYVGVDVSEEMIELARSRFPHVRLEVGDARTLDGLGDAAFDLVVFSFNGLDALSRDDRPLALAAMRRVLAPTGRVVFSSLNIDGVSFDEHPLHVAGGLTSRRVRYHYLQAARHPSTLLRAVRNHRRTRATFADGPDWSMRPLRAFEFRFLVHFTTLRRAVLDAREAGLEVLEAWGDDGSALDLTAPHCECDYFHLVCRAL